LSDDLSGHPILLHSLQVTKPTYPLPYPIQNTQTYKIPEDGQELGRNVSGQYLINKSTVQQDSVKYCICNIDARKMHNIKGVSMATPWRH
jgi:hypothetical protein